MQHNLDLSLVLNLSWDIFKKHWVKLTLIAFVVCFIDYLPDLLLLLNMEGGITLQNILILSNEPIWEITTWWGFLHTLLSILLGVFVMLYVLSITKKKSIKLDGNTLLSSFAVAVVTLIIFICSFALCVIPFFIIYPRIMFAVYYMFDNPSIGINEAFDFSIKATKGHLGTLLLIGLVTTIIILLGTLCFGVGAIPATAFVYVAEAVVYLILSGQIEASQEGTPSREESFIVEK